MAWHAQLFTLVQEEGAMPGLRPGDVRPPFRRRRRASAIEPRAPRDGGLTSTREGELGGQRLAYRWWCYLRSSESVPLQNSSAWYTASPPAFPAPSSALSGLKPADFSHASGLPPHGCRPRQDRSGASRPDRSRAGYPRPSFRGLRHHIVRPKGPGRRSGCWVERSGQP